MFVFGNLFITIAYVLDFILTIMWWMILIRALLSWVSPDPSNPIVQFLYRMTEPVLEPIRRFLPSMGIDISPIIAFLGVMVLKSFVVTTLMDIGLRFKT